MVLRSISKEYTCLLLGHSNRLGFNYYWLTNSDQEWESYYQFNPVKMISYKHHGSVSSATSFLIRSSLFLTVEFNPKFTNTYLLNIKGIFSVSPNSSEKKTVSKHSLTGEFMVLYSKGSNIRACFGLRLPFISKERVIGAVEWYCVC